MRRGEQFVAFAVLGIVGVFSVLATITLLLHQPTGHVMQNQNVYITEDQGTLLVSCKYRPSGPQEVLFLRFDGNYAVYCCPEDMTGQNECRVEHKVLLTRLY